MKLVLRRNLVLAPAALALLILNLQQSTAFAQGTAFTYQGRVTDNGTNFPGAGLFEFALVISTNGQTATATATANMDGMQTFEQKKGDMP